jgi:MFS family permease
VSTTALSQQQVMDDAVRHLVNNYSPKGNLVAWLMLASILVDAWDFNTISVVVVFIREEFNPTPLWLGLAVGGTQGGAVIGALMGGWLTDRLGRRVMFLATMAAFIVLGAAQGFVTSVEMLVVVRFVLGIALGADIATGFTYIMECLPKGRREVMGNRWQFAWSLGMVLSLIILLFFLMMGLNHSLTWRLTLGLGAVPALFILVLRKDLPETAMWLIRQGRFRDAKRVALQMYNDSLAMLPDADVTVTRPPVSEFIADTMRDPIRWRATRYGWLATFCQSAEFMTFGFYVPVLFVMVGISTLIGTNLILLAIAVFGSIGAWIMPQLTPRIGHRGVGMIGFGTVLASLLVSSFGLYTGLTAILPFAAAAMLWGQYGAASNVMTIPSVVAKPQYRGTASGFNYMFSRFPAFVSLLLFPPIVAAIGQATSALLVSIFPLVGLLAAIYLLPELFGYEKN